MKAAVLDVGGTAIKAALYIDGLMRGFKEFETEAKKGGFHVVRKMSDIINEMIADVNIEAIGVSTAGQVDFETGIIRHANENIPNYTGMKIRDILKGQFNVPVVVENDVNCAALGEGYFGAAKDMSSYLCLTYGTGVGGAIVIDGNLFRGSMGSAGEVGSMITHGDISKKGKRIEGSYEEAASTSALVKKVQKVFPDISNGRDIFNRFCENGMQEIVDEWVREVSYGLVTLIHIFNPGCIILGGGIMGQPYIINKLRKEIYDRIMPSFRNVEIRKANLGNMAGLYGAAYLSEKYLSIK